MASQMPSEQETLHKLIVIVLGDGGAEQALAWGLARSASVSRVFCLPGNGGSHTWQEMGYCVTNVGSFDMYEFDKTLQFAREQNVNLVVVASNDLLYAGVEETFRGSGIPCLAPFREIAQLQTHWSHAKRFMTEYMIPTARYGIFSDCEQAKQYVFEVDYPIVIRVSSAPAGKRVIIPKTKQEAFDALDSIMEKGKYDDACATVVVEEFLEGHEYSVLMLGDGSNGYLRFPTICTHKKLISSNGTSTQLDLGAWNVPVSEEGKLKKIDRQVTDLIFNALHEDSNFLRGPLLVSVKMTRHGPKVIKIEVGFPDLQTMLLMSMMASDVGKLLLACTDGRLPTTEATRYLRICCTVFLTDCAFPECLDNDTGGQPPHVPVSIDRRLTGGSLRATFFHMNTYLWQHELMTPGGRVMSVTGIGRSKDEAIYSAVQAAELVEFEGCHFPYDIGNVEMESPCRPSKSSWDVSVFRHGTSRSQRWGKQQMTRADLSDWTQNALQLSEGYEALTRELESSKEMAVPHPPPQTHSTIRLQNITFTWEPERLRFTHNMAAVTYEF